MRVASFDIFDTLLTRMVAGPTDLFLAVGEELKARGLTALEASEFASQRALAETEARKAFEHSEVTFDEIYAKLAPVMSWGEEQVRIAKEIELTEERKSLRVAPRARTKLEAARKEANRILFLSDMYLPREFLEDLLREAGLWKEGDRIFVSGESKCSKAKGTLYARLRKELGEIKSWRHLGDNAHSDVKMADAHGIESEHFAECELTRFEKTFRPKNFGSLQGSKIAGAIRYARLCGPEQDVHRRGIWDIGVSVAGPFLFGFVAWVLEEATKRGMKRLYFISRDGEILLKVARVIIAKWGYDIDARYLHGSRQAWRPAAGEALDDWYGEWVMAVPTPTDLNSIFARLGLAPEKFEGVLNGGGFVRARWSEILDFETRGKLWKLIKESGIGVAVIDERKRRRVLARRYLRQEGLGDDVALGVVDIGWFGSMQRSLEAIVETKQSLHGFYFGLWSGANERRLSYWREAEGFRNLQQTNISLFERFAVALHGSVLGYVEEANGVRAELEGEKSQGLLDWGAALWQESIVKVTELLLEAVSRREFCGEEFFLLARRNFELFAIQPSREEALAFGKMPLQDQGNEITAATLTPELSEWEILRALLDYRRRLPGWWMEGTAKLRGSPTLKLFLLAKRLKHGV